MENLTIWHNPKCSKSRVAMEIIKSSGSECRVVEYLKDTPTKDEIKQALKLLNISARELMRTGEEVYKELNLDAQIDEEKLIEAMYQNPILIQRPIIFKNGKAIIGRPTSLVEEFIA